MTILFKCDAPACGDPNQEIRATRFTEVEIYTSASGRLWRKVRRVFVDTPTASGADWWRRARTDSVIDSAAGGVEADFWASSEVCADAIDLLYPEP